MKRPSSYVYSQAIQRRKYKLGVYLGFDSMYKIEKAREEWKRNVEINSKGRSEQWKN